MLGTVSNRFRTSFALSAAALAVTVAASPARAQAAVGSPTGALTVDYLRGSDGARVSPTRCTVIVLGQIRMSRTEAQRLLNSGHRVIVRLWGEDPQTDDLLREYSLIQGESGTPGSIRRTQLWVNTEGIGFRTYERVSPGLLDEADAVGVPERDELYAGMRLVNSRGATVRSGETNRVTGMFTIGYAPCA